MSQYPNPYLGPQQPYGTTPYAPYPASFEPPRPEKRAGTLMILLGCLGMTCGGLGLLLALNWEKVLALYPPEMRSQLQAAATPRQILGQQIVTLLVALLFIVLGIFVRGGRRMAMVLGTILTGLMLLLCALAVVGSIVAMSTGNSLGGANICVAVVVGGVMLWQLLWLIGALRGGGGGAAARQLQAAYQAQYWQYLQQQQAYNAAMAAQQPPGAVNPQQQQAPQNPYNAPAAGPSQGGAGQTGWQWSAPPPPPPPPAAPNSSNQNPGGPYGQGPQQ
jgi:hypothetical protein